MSDAANSVPSTRNQAPVISSLPTNSEPLVSVLIVAHDAGDYLRPCVASLRGQTYRKIEIVIVDNASTDPAVGDVEREFGGAGGLRVVRSEENLGPSGGAVLGLPHCRGELVARIDADDIALPERLALQVAYLREHPEKDAVGGDVLRIDAEGRPLSVGLSLRGEFMRRHASKWYIGCFHTTLLARREVFRKRTYNPSLFATQDTELIESIAREGRLGVVPAILGLYRQHRASITERFADLRRLEGNELRRRLSAAIGSSAKRTAVAVADFTFRADDSRLKMQLRERNRWFEDESRRESNWLGAAYFASINRRWFAFVAGLARASAAGTDRKEIRALFLCRSFWSVRIRLAQSMPWLLRRLIPTADAGHLQRSLRLARAVNALRKVVRYSAAGAVVAIVCYFGLKPLPSARDVPWVPRRSVYFLDHHNFLCNVVAFAGMAAVVHLSLAGLAGERRGAHWRRAAWLAALAVAIECIQIFLPRRVFDLQDIAAGWIGVLGATWVLLPPKLAQRPVMQPRLDAAVVKAAT